MAKVTPPKVRISSTLRTYSDIINALDALEVQFGEYLSELAREYMKEYIQQEVYLNDALLSGGEYSGTYERTSQFLNAIEVKKNSKNQWAVGIDGRKISAISRPDGFHAHESFNGVSAAGAMSSFIEYGNNSSIYGYAGIHYIEKTQQYIENILPSAWAKFKQANGLK